jgi:pimeloyl-ACP methyl ester carboxylesterase
LAQHRLGSGPPLVLIHGIGSEWPVWRPVLAALARERDVIAVDLPGFGASAPLAPGVESTVPALAAAVVAHLEALGLRDAHLAGNSLGGWVALEVARLGRARSVVGISPAGFWNDLERRYAKAVLWSSARLARRLLPLASLAFATTAGRTAFLSGMMARPANVGAEDAVASMRAFARAPGFDATLAWAARPGSGFTGGAEVRCPVTIAWGDRDRLLLPRQARRALAAIPGARHVVLAGCGHVPMSDDPDLVARAILEGTAVA